MLTCAAIGVLASGCDRSTPEDRGEAPVRERAGATTATGAGAGPDAGPAVDPGETPDRDDSAPRIITPDDGRIEIARRLLRAGQPADAELILRAIVDRDPANARATFFLALSLHEQKRYGEASPIYARLDELEETYAEAVHRPYFQSWCLYYGGEPAAARTLLDAYLAGMPNNGDAHFLRGLLAFDADDLDAAQASFERGIELQSTFPNRGPAVAACYVRLADVHIRRDRYEDAERALREASRRAPRAGEVWFKLSMVLDRLDRPEQAEAARMRWQDLKNGGRSVELGTSEGSARQPPRGG